MKKFILVLIFLFSGCAIAIEEISPNKHDCACEHHHHPTEPVTVKNGSVLNIRECIAVGMQNSPVIKEYAHKLEIAKSNIGIAKSEYFPEFGAGVGYRQEINSNRYDFLRNYREIPTVGISLNKMIWDFGKTTANIKMEEFLKIAAEYEFEDAVCETVFEIKAYYYKLLYAKAAYETQKISYNIQKSIVKEIEKLVKSGQRDKADLLNAQLAQFYIKSELLNAENEYLNAKEELNNAMFLKNAPDYLIYETQSFSYKPTKQTTFKNVSYPAAGKVVKDDTIFQHPNFAPDKAVEIAYKNSPDIKALIAVKQSFEQALIFVKRNYYPSINAGLGYDFVNSNIYNNNGLSVAVTVDSTINGMRQKYDIKGAKAQLALADTEIDTFKDNLYFSVRKNLNTAEIAYKNIPVCKNQMDKAAEYFDITYKNYLLNKMVQLDLEDARMLYIKSVNDYISSQFEYNLALIQLEKSMHEHLIDYHDDAEHAADFHEGNENEALSKLIRCNKKHK